MSEVNGNGTGDSVPEVSDLISAPTENRTFKARQVNQLFTPVQKEEFENSAIDPDVLNLNVSILDTSWVVQNLHGMEKENDDILTLADILGMKLTYNQNGRINGAQLSRLQRMKGGWHTLPYYGLADREIVTDLRFKPTVALPDEKGKAPKYLGRIGGETRAYLPNIPDKLWLEMAESFGVEKSENCYGEWLLANSTIPILHNEGEKKTLASTSVGYPSIGLAGYNMGCRTIHNEDGSQRTYQLIPDIAAIALGRVHYLTWDRDTKSSIVRAVIKERKKYAKLLYEAGAERVLSIQWDGKKYKGVDDFIAAEGVEGLRKAIAEAFEFPRPKTETEAESEQKTKSLPSPLEMSFSLVETVLQHTKYDATADQWWEYDGAGKWLPAPDTIMFGLVQNYLVEIIPDFTPSYIRNCIEFARTQLLIREWNEASSLDYLPFINGVLDLKSNKLLPHSPDYQFTWQLPRQYSILSTGWNNIGSFLDRLCCHNQDLKDIAIAFAAATLKGRSDLQLFLFLSGTGANGKGVYTDLLSALVGEENTHASTLGELNSNRFEPANLRGRRLLVLPDEDKYSGGLGVFKNATGGGMLRYERKGKDCSNFKYRGMVVIAANPNNLLFSGGGYAIGRRKIDFPCLAKITKADRRDLTGDFAAELPVFTTYLLSLKDEWVTSTLKNADTIEVVKQMQWEMAVRENSTAAFYSDRLVVDPNASIGCQRLFTIYESYCANSGMYRKSINNFTPALLELCNDSLGLSITKVHTRLGYEIRGLRLRTETDNVTAVTGRDGQCDGSEAAPSKDVTGVTGHSTSEQKIENKKRGKDLNPTPTVEKEEYKKSLDRPSYPSHPSPMRQGNDSSPSRPVTPPVTTRHTRHAEDPNLMSMVDGLAALADLPTEQGLEGLDDLYSVWAPDEMSKASAILKSSNSKAYAAVSKLVAFRSNLKVSDRVRVEGSGTDFKVGDRVEYIGSNIRNQKHYAGDLVVHEIANSGITCMMPSGKYTSWIDPDDLQLLAQQLPIE